MTKLLSTVTTAAMFLTVGCNPQPVVPAPRSSTESLRIDANHNEPDALPNAAFASEDKEVIELVLAGETIDATDSEGKTALYYAAVNNDAPLLNFLLDHGANPDFRVDSKAGETPLFAAINHRNLQGMEIMLKRGANSNAKTISGVTPIFTAAEAGWLPAVQLLLDHGARADAISNAGLTPLSVVNPNNIASSVPEESLLAVDKALLEHGAPTKIADEDGFTPAKRARWMGYHKVADLLETFVPTASKQ